MPRYHFHVKDGTELRDEVGTVLPDIVFARREAIRLAGRLLEIGAETIKPGREWQMEVTDANGVILFQLEFTVSASPPAPEASGDH